MMSSRKTKMVHGTAVLAGIDRGAKRRPALPHGRTLFGEARDPHLNMTGFKKEFLFPPFSVLNTREGLWQARKRMWLGMGIESELGRGSELLKSENDLIANEEKRKKYGNQAPKFGGLTFVTGPRKHLDETSVKILDTSKSGASIFDPVMCELMYKWFCPAGGMVIDPFAGGSVRGIVAQKLGFYYTGMDLSEEQVNANRAQAGKICSVRNGDANNMPIWLVGDSTQIKKRLCSTFAEDHAKWLAYDFVFSCPPYANLEVYSQAPADISNMAYPDFLRAYKKIIRRTCSLLKPNRFAAWVIGEVRDTKQQGSPYYGFVPDTIAAFREAGLSYYNEIVLLTAVGSLPLRSRKAFQAARKVGKAHQNVLIFCKGDPKEAAKAVEATK